jgi:predicted SnoaL-like aldol condensation-catalyzing enzyme
VTPADENRALVARFLDALGQGDVATAAGCFDAERYYSHAWEGDLGVTWEKMKATRRQGRFRAWDSKTVALVADGDRVVHHAHHRVTEASTGKQADLFTLEIWRVEDGLIVEHWGGLQEYERFRAQLG